MEKKTSKKEQERRISEFNKNLNVFNSFLKKIKEEKDPEKKEEILEDPSYENIRRTMSLGPTYIIWKKDYEEMATAMIYGERPSFEVLMESMKTLEIEFRQKREWCSSDFNTSLYCL